MLEAATAATGQAEETGICGTLAGVVSLNTLTTKEKNMNMAKPGTVSTAGNYFSTPETQRKIRAGGMPRYTY